METIRKYEKQTEQAFGGLRFETAVPEKPTGNPPQFVYLTEDQATFLMTLSRNTPEVVRCKVILVTQFSQAKKALMSQGYYQVPHTSVYVRRLDNVRDHVIDDNLWSVFREGAEVLLLVEKDFRVPVQQMDICDGSIGKKWSGYREGQSWAVEASTYIHRFPDYRPDCFPAAYQLAELPHFRKWLRDFYVPQWLPKYLVEKYGKRAVLQIYTEQKQVNDYISELTEEKKKSKKQENLFEVFLAAREVMENRKLLLDS